MEKETWVIFGLGNPGKQYEHSRHNAGFDTIDELAGRWGLTFGKEKLSGVLAETTHNGARVILVKPQTFMNLSGACVDEVINWYKVPGDHMLVVYDDIDLPVSQLRMRKKGSAGTHNGMRSIIPVMHGEDFPRLRVGVGAPESGWTLVDWVLGHYRKPEEQNAMEDAFKRAADTIEIWLNRGIDAAMQHCSIHNPKPNKEQA